AGRSFAPGPPRAMPLQHECKFGDKVLHTAKPEWGTGGVTAAVAATQDGKPCQRLPIRFDRAGTKTLSTAFATLRPAEDAPEMAPSRAESKTAILGAAGEKPVEETVAGLPEPATEPFARLPARLKAALSLLRFSDQAGSLIDWAA